MKRLHEMRLRNGCYGDIRCSDVYGDTLRAAGYCLGIGVFILGFLLLAFSLNNKEEDARMLYNYRAAEFNALPEPTRVAIEPLLERGFAEGQTTLELERPIPIGPLFRQTVIPIMALACACILSTVTFVSYDSNISSMGFFLADLPLKTAYGWILLLSCFVGWPFMAVSALRMAVYKHERGLDEREANTKKKAKAEKANTE